MSTPAKAFEIAIIGGGLGGLCLAIRLLRLNVPFHIYEAAPSFGEIGAGIMCGPHAVNALRLISPDLLAAFQEHVTTNLDGQRSWRWGSFRFGVDIQRKDGPKMGDVDWEVFLDAEIQHQSELCGTRGMSSVHRARFLDSMVKLIPEHRVSFNKPLKRLEQDENEVRMYFVDGTETRATATVGCDGIKSKVRANIMTAVGKTVEPQYVGEYAYRSLIDMSVAEGILGVELAGNTNVWESYDGYVIHYPVEKGRMINVVAVLQDKASTEEHSYERLVKPVPRKSMYKDFQHWDPRLQLLLREFKSSDQWSLWDLIHREPYNYGRVCLLGDAAHAAVPHLGSGAGMAVEDAYILGSLIDGWGRTHLEVALSAYDQVRRSRTQKLARLSREAGQKYTFTLPGVLDNPEALQAYAKDQFRWIWNFDLEHQLYEAWDTAAGMVNRSP